MVRIRADHWNAVLPDYRLGWEESSRQACLENLGPLSNVARAMAAGGDRSGHARRSAAPGRTALLRSISIVPTAASTRSPPTASR